MLKDKNEILREIPSVDALVHEARKYDWAANVSHRVMVDAIRRSVDHVRKLLLENGEEARNGSIQNRMMTQIRKQVQLAIGPHYRKAINATGIILHTGLGRAVLADKAIRQIAEELSGYSLLQIDLKTGERSKRDERIEWLLQQLTGCEAATVVNNNAAATAIVLNTVAKGREVIVSRGQLVEIGGSFRLPEVMEASGAKLVEVGTTNKTHPRDYENAITENTAAIMRVHPSNYKIVGFAQDVSLAELEQIAHRRNLALIDDIGAGALFDFSRFGFQDEPTLPGSIRTGADIVTASADKLIGASQGGIIRGRREWIKAIRKNPFARIVRVGKLTLAALEATLSLFLDETVAMREIPTLKMLVRELKDIEEQAIRIADTIDEQVPQAEITVADGFSQMGSGSLPGQNLPTKLVSIRSPQMTSEELARRLRGSSPPIVARIHKEQVLLDPRTLMDGEDTIVIRAITEILSDAR